MFRSVARSFLRYQNPIIAKQFPKEAVHNERIVSSILSGRSDKYIDDLISSYMCIKLHHPLSYNVFKIALLFNKK